MGGLSKLFYLVLYYCRQAWRICLSILKSCNRFNENVFSYLQRSKISTIFNHNSFIIHRLHSLPWIAVKFELSLTFFTLSLSFLLGRSGILGRTKVKAASNRILYFKITSSGCGLCPTRFVVSQAASRGRVKPPCDYIFLDHLTF